MEKMNPKSLVTQIIALFFLFNALSLFIFAVYLYQQDKKINMQYIEEGIQEISKEKAQIVSLIMNQIKSETENLAYISYACLTDTYNVNDLPSCYQRDYRGIMGRIIDKSGNKKISNIYLPQNVELTPAIASEIIATEKLDDVFNMILKRNKYIQWAYITTENGLMRVFPYASNDLYDNPAHNQLKDMFYVTANKENNPSKKAVWTKPYYDYLLTGWMVTCSCPIYDKDKLLAVVSLDVRLDTFRKDILADFRLGKTGFAFLLNNEGDIIYHPQYIQLKTQQGKPLERNIHNENLPDDYKAIIDSMTSGSKGIGRYKAGSGNDLRIVAYSQIPEQNWALGIEINQESYLIDNKIHTSRFLIYSIFSILFLAVFAFIIFRQYSKPFAQLTNGAKKISEGKFEPIEVISNYYEIKTLSEAFNLMSHKLKSYTESLIHRTKQIETVFNSIGGLLMIVAPDYQIKMLNKKGYYRFCKIDQDIIGRTCHKIIANSDHPCNGCKIEEVIKTGKPVHTRFALKDEIYHNAYYPIFNGEKSIDEIVVYSQNITERVMIEKELSQAEKLAGIGQLSSAIAHELKNPLTVIKGAAYILHAYTKDMNNPMISENLNLIDSNVDNAENVIYNLLNFSSKSKYSYEQIDIGKLIEQILLLERRNIIKQNIEIEIFFNPDPLMVFGQIEPLKHIFLNIISNAMHALSNGGKLTIKGNYTYGGTDKIEVSISDSGSGIPYEMHDKVFKPFFTTKEQGSGTGLGLWITKLTVEKLSGEIKLKSMPGKGTTFIIIIPAKMMEKGE